VVFVSEISSLKEKTLSWCYSVMFSFKQQKPSLPGAEPRTVFQVSALFLLSPF
jgi:hypothetical protein